MSLVSLAFILPPEPKPYEGAALCGLLLGLWAPGPGASLLEVLSPGILISVPILKKVDKYFRLTYR
jgi:hypothetical protein